MNFSLQFIKFCTFQTGQVLEPHYLYGSSDDALRVGYWAKRNGRAITQKGLPFEPPGIVILAATVGNHLVATLTELGP